MVTLAASALPSILRTVPHQSEKAPTLSASATLCRAASSTASGLFEASAGLASACSPSRNAFCAGMRSWQGRSKQPPRTRPAPPRRKMRRPAMLVLRRLGFRLGALFLLEFLLGELADRRLGQFGADLERDRHLVLADLAFQMLLQFLEGERGTGLQFHEHLGRFLAIRIGDADHDALVDCRMLVDRFLDHARVDVVARRDDQVLGAIDQEEPAVLV